MDDSEAQVVDAEGQSEFSKTDQPGLEFQEEKPDDKLECMKQDVNLETKSDETTEPEQKSDKPEQETETKATGINDIESSISQLDLKEDS